MNKRQFIFLIFMFVFVSDSKAEDDFHRQRQLMVKEIEETVRFTSEYTGKQALDPQILEVLKKVPRHEFIPSSMQAFAYLNQPLPIGNNQTISQPYIVALMTELASINRESIVLEVGTGSGYQAAVLAELVKHVYSIEIVEELGKRASETLQRLGYHNATVRIGDGYHGWLEHAPYDAILVTAAPEIIPQDLIDQLKSGGKLVIPVGKQSAAQVLQVLEKDKQGTITKRDVLPVGFVPLTRNH
jgi:protein-L-isoaspartate(D-aspartate) O-methyltransferase